MRLRARCRARLLDTQASLREQTTAAARLVEETRALIASLKRVAPKEKGPIGLRDSTPRKNVLPRLRPARTSIDFALHLPPPRHAYTKCGLAEALVRITASIATLALGEQYEQVMSASMRGQPLDASVVRQKLRRIGQLLDPGQGTSC